MKTALPASILMALACLLSGCGTESDSPPSPEVSDTPFGGTTLPIVVEQNVNRKDPSKSSFVSDAVRNYLRDALDESMATHRVFRIVEAAPGMSKEAVPAHVAASIIYVRERDITFNLGPIASTQKATVDAKMEVRLTRPGHAEIVTTGESSVARSANTVIVAARQFKDWVFDDSWASVACKEALQKACAKLAATIEAEQRALPPPSASLERQHSE